MWFCHVCLCHCPSSATSCQNKSLDSPLNLNWNDLRDRGRITDRQTERQTDRQTHRWGQGSECSYAIAVGNHCPGEDAGGVPRCFPVCHGPLLLLLQLVLKPLHLLWPVHKLPSLSIWKASFKAITIKPMSSACQATGLHIFFNCVVFLFVINCQRKTVVQWWYNCEGMIHKQVLSGMTGHVTVYLSDWGLLFAFLYICDILV